MASVSTTPAAAAPAAPPLDPASQARVEEALAELLAERSEAEAALIARAAARAQAAHAGQKRLSGEPYVLHALAVARILAALKLDADTIAAALLHDVVEDTPVTLADIEQEFGATVARLVDGVTKMGIIQGFRPGAEGGRERQAQAESLRKMLLAMAEDVRVVLIKLADRLHNLRTLAALPEDRQRAMARETLEIFAPLANRLGIWQLKWELEDLAFRYLEPATYRHIAAQLAEKRADRERYIADFVARLAGELARAGIAAEVSGRPKHIYSIWRKMQRKGLDFTQVFDVRAVRVLVETVRDCYAALGVVHSLWQPVPGEFDDYIATPKENHYRSLHTAVIGPEGKTVEVQIRTHEMHREAEYGLAAHWRYKEELKADEGYQRKLAWLRSLLEWKDQVSEAAEFVDRFKNEVFEDRVYVFTPKGNIVDLPAGATPLDFAYHIHTEVGHRCRGARVDGRIVPLTYKLKTGEQVEILTVKEGGPSRDWLNPHLGYLVTSKARSKVQAWFKQQNHEASVALGREELEREFQRLGIADIKYEALAARLGFAAVGDFLAAVGRGEVRAAQILNAVQAWHVPGLLRQGPPPPPRPAGRASSAAASAAIRVQGVGNLLTRMARCCQPVPGDPIVGFITRGQGVTVHRRDCPNALRAHAEHSERLIEVSWGTAIAGHTFAVEVEVTAYDRPGLLRDLTALLANEKINVAALSTTTDRSEQLARITMTLEVPDLDTLARVLALMDQIPNVLEVRRRVH